MVNSKTWFTLFLCCNAALSQVLFDEETNNEGSVTFEENPQIDDNVNIQDLLGIKETDVDVQTRFSL